MPRIRVIGGGLAGPEAALTAAKLGIEVDLYEMRPVKMTPAHETAEFGELVCSNSLKSESENSAPWLLKQEMRRAGSELLKHADLSAVPAGHALAVDRVEFSWRIAEAIASEPRITVHREEVTALNPEDGIMVLASGPLTSSALSAEVARLRVASIWRSTTRSARLSRPTRSIWSGSISPPATTKGPPTISIAR